jgi:ankyrin repeat protein
MIYMIAVCPVSPLHRITNEAVDVSRKTALHYASEAGYLKIVKVLVDHGAYVDNTGMCIDKL